MDVPSESNCSLLLLNEDIMDSVKMSRSGSVLSFPQSFCQPYTLDLIGKVDVSNRKWIDFFKNAKASWLEKAAPNIANM